MEAVIWPALLSAAGLFVASGVAGVRAGRALALVAGAVGLAATTRSAWPSSSR